jgi:hypothetical protein
MIVPDELWTRVKDRQNAIRHANPVNDDKSPFWDK